MKKKLSMLTVAVAATFGLVACGTSENNDSTKVKVGMMTDSGTIDDKSFNQGLGTGLNVMNQKREQLFLNIFNQQVNQHKII